MRHIYNEYLLIQRLRRALYLTSIDAEKNGFSYGAQSICVRALADSAKWLEANKPVGERT